MTYQSQKERRKTGDNLEDNSENVDQAVEELLRLAGDDDIEGKLMANDKEDDDSSEGYEHDEMTEDKLKKLSASIAPVRLLLTKVRLQIVLLITNYLISAHTAAKNHIHNQELDNPSSSTLVFNSSQS